MRKGSTILGSLGAVSLGTAMLILPLNVTGGATGPALAPGWAAEEVSSPNNAERSTPAAADETADEAAIREAIEKRCELLQSPGAQATTQLASRGGHKTVAKAKPRVMKVIHTRATWYGPGFHGHRTASGERFNIHAMTLASRHLPFGTRVRVVNSSNGRSAIARVNDRGPFRSGYTADLSQGLARKIGMSSSGAIKLEILDPHSKAK